jgi:hypothetical protein
MGGGGSLLLNWHHKFIVTLLLLSLALSVQKMGTTGLTVSTGKKMLGGTHVPSSPHGSCAYAYIAAYSAYLLKLCQQFFFNSALKQSDYPKVCH